MRWSLLGTGFQQGLRILVSLVLASFFLAPADFGLMAMAYLVIGFLESLQSLGTVEAIVQRKSVSDSMLSSVFHLHLFVGGGLFVVAFAGAGIAGRLLADPDVVWVLRVLGLSLGLGALGFVPRAILMRAMQFDRIALATILSAVVHAAVALVCGALGAGVWSLVAGHLAGAAATNLTLWVASGWRPRAHFAASDLRVIAKFSRNLSALTVFSYWTKRLDHLVIARFLGAGSLGLYGMAQRVTLGAVGPVQWAIDPVLFTHMSSLQEEKERMREAWVRTTAATAVVLVPAMALLGVIAGPLVLVLLGEEWRPIVPLVMILAAVGVLNTLMGRLGPIYRAMGRTDLQLWWGVASGIVVALSYIIGLRWGVVGVTAAFAVGRLLIAPIALRIPFRLIGLRFGQVATALAPCMVSTAGLVAASIATRLALEQLAASPMLVLLGAAAAGGLTYLVVIRTLWPTVVDDLLRAVRLRAEGDAGQDQDLERRFEAE